MAVEVNITAVCDKCGKRVPIVGLCGFDAILPNGWNQTTKGVVTCNDCNKKDETE